MWSPRGWFELAEAVYHSLEHEREERSIVCYKDSYECCIPRIVLCRKPLELMADTWCSMAEYPACYPASMLVRYVQTHPCMNVWAIRAHMGQTRQQSLQPLVLIAP